MDPLGFLHLAKSSGDFYPVHPRLIDRDKRVKWIREFYIKDLNPTPESSIEPWEVIATFSFDKELQLKLHKIIVGQESYMRGGYSLENIPVEKSLNVEAMPEYSTVKLSQNVPQTVISPYESEPPVKVQKADFSETPEKRIRRNKFQPKKKLSNANVKYAAAEKNRQRNDLPSNRHKRIVQTAAASVNNIQTTSSVIPISNEWQHPEQTKTDRNDLKLSSTHKIDVNWTSFNKVIRSIHRKNITTNPISEQIKTGNKEIVN